VRRDNLNPAISPLKYDFDAICEARAFVRSGFQTEIADKEPFEELIRIPYTRQKILLRFRSLALISLAKCAAKDVPNSVASFEEVT